MPCFIVISLALANSFPVKNVEDSEEPAKVNVLHSHLSIFSLL